MTGDASKPYTCHGVVDPSARARWLLSAVTASGSQGSHAFGRLRKSSSVLHQLTPMSMYTLRGREHRPSSDAAPVAALTPTQANASTWRRRNPQHCMRTTPSIENFTTRAQRSVASHACKQKKSPRRVRTGTEPSQKEAPRRDGGHIMRLAALVLVSAHDLCMCRYITLEIAWGDLLATTHPWRARCGLRIGCRSFAPLLQRCADRTPALRRGAVIS